ncbi:MAG: hypothetical protein ACREUO_02960 [Burkholderiales bacterium]
MSGTFRKSVVISLALAATSLASGCGTPYATLRTPDGDELMLLGHDPVAYFTMGKPVRGDPKLKVTLPERTYYFVSEEHRHMQGYPFKWPK